MRPLVMPYCGQTPVPPGCIVRHRRVRRRRSSKGDGEIYKDEEDRRDFELGEEERKRKKEEKDARGLERWSHAHPVLYSTYCTHTPRFTGKRESVINPSIFF